MRTRHAVLAKLEPRASHPNRGEATRQKLIDAALRIFGAYGFDGASTRMLADAAGANLAAIPYYFGGKEGLYRAAAQFVVESSSSELSPIIEQIDGAIVERGFSRKMACELLHELLDRVSALVIGSRVAETWASFVMREQLHPGAAFEIIYEGMMRPITDAAIRLVATIQKRAADDPRAIIATQAILGQVLIFRVGRAAALRSLGWKSFSEDHLRLIRSVVRENVDRIVRQP
jgi:AcrR family transcriptional regulator